MSRQYPTCPHCFQPVPDSRLFCQAYREHFRDLLRLTPELLRELNITLSKQDRIAPGSTGGARPKGHAKPLVYNVNASIARDKLLAGTVVKWARIARGHFARLLKPVPDALDAFELTLPTDPIALLIALSERAANYDWFADMTAELEDAFHAGEAAIDVAEGRLEAGVCEHCGTRICGYLSTPTFICEGCGVVGDIVERQQQMWNAALDLTVNPALAEAYLGFFIRLEVLRKTEGLPGVLGPLVERPPKGALISVWATRGHLREVDRYVERGVTPDDGWALYRFGDIIDVAMAQLRKADERKQAGEARRAAARGRRGDRAEEAA